MGMHIYKIAGIVIAVFLILFIPLRNHFKNANRRQIPWSQNNKLEWSDFRGRIPDGFNGAAVTATGYGYNERLTKDSIEIQMINFFRTDSSVVVRQNATDYVLNHEQRHFDITEIYVRRLREYIRNWDGFTKGEYNEYLANGVDRIFSDSLAFQYEAQTDHGANRAAQSQWDRKIDNLLNRYDAYQKPVFKIYYQSTPENFDENPFELYMMGRRHKTRIDTR